jgi:hypothetical protein
LPTLGIKGRFTVYGAGLEPMSALANSTFDRAGAAKVGFPPTAVIGDTGHLSLAERGAFQMSRASRLPFRPNFSKLHPGVERVVAGHE